MTTMNKIIEKCLVAFLTNMPYKSAIIRTDGHSIWSYELEIARWTGSFFDRRIAVRKDNEAFSNTTKKQINAIEFFALMRQIQVEKVNWLDGKITGEPTRNELLEALRITGCRKPSNALKLMDSEGMEKLKKVALKLREAY